MSFKKFLSKAANIKQNTHCNYKHKEKIHIEDPTILPAAHNLSLSL